MQAEFKCDNIAFSAFLLSRGVPSISHFQRGRKIVWVFNINQADLAQAQADWPQSAECRFFNSYLTLKSHLRERA